MASPPNAGSVSTACAIVAIAATMPSLNAAVHLRRLVGALDTGDACGKVDETLGDKHDRCERGVRTVRGIETARGDTDDPAVTRLAMPKTK